MSKFDLRDISQRLESSSDIEAVVFEFLGYLQALHSDWRASLTFYEVSSDSLVSLYERHGDRLVHRAISVPVDQLPARLVRKFFHPSAFFNPQKGRGFGQWFKSSPYFEPEAIDAPALKGVIPLPRWQSSICMPLADRDDILALLVVASERKNAFGDKAAGDIIPVKSIASLALTHHLHRANGKWNGGTESTDARAAAADFQERIRELSRKTEDLQEDNRAKTERLTTLTDEFEQLGKNSSESRQELERVKGTLTALEEQTVVAAQHLNEAYVELDGTQARLAEKERTIGFMKEVFQMLSQEHAPEDVGRTLVAWLCKQFEVERCSLMVLEGTGETLRIAAQHGIDPAVAERVKVRVGQGVAGWVAHHRKPLFVRVRDEEPEVQRMVKETYNSDSFISVPLVYNNRLHGVLSLSNKKDGEPFESGDLDRAIMAASIVAVTLGAQEMERRAA